MKHCIAVSGRASDNQRQQLLVPVGGHIQLWYIQTSFDICHAAVTALAATLLRRHCSSRSSKRSW